MKIGVALLAVQALLLATPAAAADPSALAQARSGVAAETTLKIRQKKRAPAPPAGTLRLVSYPAPNGPTSGYLTPEPAGGQRRPAIIWISGGDMAIGDFWSAQPPASDQSAAVFRDAGMMVFYPSLRGLNGNPGQSEGFFGEVDDLIAATAWLKQQPGVDPDRVYLGGHSAGGTLVLLAAAFAPEWRAVFSFGPVRDPATYRNPDLLPIDAANVRGADLRAPGKWLESIKTTVFVIEGDQRGNAAEVRAMQAATTNALLRFRTVAGCDHFSVLRPVSDAIAKALIADRLADLDKETAFDAACAPGK